jgi:hypothetical protein
MDICVLSINQLADSAISDPLLKDPMLAESQQLPRHGMLLAP